ncbi:MAG: hypothetical protein M3Y87_28145, partial [Myxococcota bacterium]|nr:hypothetical protein [Myxococcota bacterium]
VTHAEWWARITESPPIAWAAADAGARYQISIGSEPGETDMACWTDVDERLEHTFRSLSLEDGGTYFANVRTVRDGIASAASSSTGWTVDIVAPAPPTAVIDAWVPTTGEARWEAIEEDGESGFAGYRVGVGTAPGLDDVRPFAAVPAGERILDLSALELPVGVWHHVSVQTVDVAGNRSATIASNGFLRCPEGFGFVPRNDEEGIGTGSFCVATYEMKVRGSDDGDVTFDGTQIPESRATGTPWVNMHASVIDVACASMGEGHAGLSPTPTTGAGARSGWAP